MRSNSELVKLLKSGRPKVYKKDLREKYGAGKGTILAQTLKEPKLLEDYRYDKRSRPPGPLSHLDLADPTIGGELPDWDSLLRDVVKLSTGHAAASDFEKAIKAILSSLFYPSLVHPIEQREIHEGRKRIDITYTNLGNVGFFGWLSKHYPAANIFVECKNYGKEVGNPELDQIAGRFSPSRGQVGVLVCRQFENKDHFMKRCRDTAQDQRGYVIALDDADLAELAHARKRNERSVEFRLLKERFDMLVM